VYRGQSTALLNLQFIVMDSYKVQFMSEGCMSALFSGTQQSNGADDTLGWCDCGLQIDCSNTVATVRLGVDRTLVTSWIFAGRRVDGVHVNHGHRLVPILHSYTAADVVPRDVGQKD